MGDLRSAPLPPVTAADHARGDDDGPVVVVYADFTCPHCAVAAARLAGLPIRHVFRHFALTTKHPRSVTLAQAAEAAARQGAFWEMHDSLFADRGRQDDPHLWERIRALGLDVDRFETDRRSEEVATRVAEQVRGGLRAGVATTPTLFVEGEMHPGPPSRELLERLIDESHLADFVNTRSPAYKERGLDVTKMTKKQAIDLMMEDINLMKRPLVIRGKKAVFGFNPEEL
jgi:protein-disulfide isomerase